MHRSAINAGNTKRNEKKLERSWEELQSEKRDYLKRKVEEGEQRRVIREMLKGMEDDEVNDFWGDT